MNRPHSHRNLLWSGHWPVVFHKQTGTLLYSLFVSWSFYWQSNGRVDGFTMCTLSDAYADVYLSYCKKRKRKASRTRMLKRRMIRLLEKLLIQMDEIHREYGAALRYTQDYRKRLSIIRKVLVQEKDMFEGRKVSDRIVSIDRHYVRPIVRSKETKSVEFGAKVNNIQIDGISFIEHISFKAFNEDIRLKDVSIRPTTGIKPLYTTIATVTMNLIVTRM